MVLEFCAQVMLEPAKKKYNANGLQLYDVQALNLAQFVFGLACWYDILDSAIDDLFKPEHVHCDGETMFVNIVASVESFMDDLCNTHPHLYRGIGFVFSSFNMKISMSEQFATKVVAEEGRLYQQFADAIDQMKYQILP